MKDDIIVDIIGFFAVIAIIVGVVLLSKSYPRFVDCFLWILIIATWIGGILTIVLFTGIVFLYICEYKPLWGVPIRSGISRWRMLYYEYLFRHPPVFKRHLYKVMWYVPDSCNDEKYIMFLRVRQDVKSYKRAIQAIFDRHENKKAAQKRNTNALPKRIHHT